MIQTCTWVFSLPKNYRNDQNKPRRKEHYLILQLSKDPEKNAYKISIFAKSRVKISLFTLFSTFTNFVNATSASAHEERKTQWQKQQQKIKQKIGIHTVKSVQFVQYA